jgi:DNA-binding NarL/FixJ family response regulator
MKIEKWTQGLTAGGLATLSSAPAERAEEGEPFAPGFPVDLISPRELEVFRLLGRGCSICQIAEEMRVSSSTVHTFRDRIKDKLKLSSPTEVLREALRCHDKLLGGEPARVGGVRLDIKERVATRSRLHTLHVGKKNAMMMAANLGDGNSPARDSVIEQFSPRELEVFRLLGRAWSTRQIAKHMHIRFKTVHSFRGRIKKKLKLSSATEVLRVALRWHDRQNLKSHGPS